MKRGIAILIFVILFANFVLVDAQDYSNYEENPKTMALEYILRGETKEIEFVGYEGVKNYFLGIPRDFYYANGSRLEMKNKILDDEIQKHFLIPLVEKIQEITADKTDQVRIAVSIVQSISFGSSEKLTRTENGAVIYPLYPYEVVYDGKGVCSEKADLMVFLLRELGYDAGYFYYKAENHEAVALKCSSWNNLKNTGYCFIEPTGNAIISDANAEYVGIGKLKSEPELIKISQGQELKRFLYEYRDARKMNRIRNGWALFKDKKLEELRNKYGLIDGYNV